MLSYLRLSILICVMLLSYAIASVNTRALNFRSGGNLAALKYVTIAQGILHTTETADEEGRVSFTTIAPRYFTSGLRVFKACLTDGSVLAVRPRDLIYSQSSDEFIITGGKTWQEKDIEQPRSRGFFRKARL